MTRSSMRMPSNTFTPQEQRQITAPGCSRRTFLLVGGAVAALAGGGWWLHARQSSQPPVVPVDTHRVLNLPVSGDPAPSYRYLPGLEYAWLPDSMHLAVALPDTLFVVNVRTGKTVWQQARSLEKEQDAVLLLNWSADGTQIQVVQESGVPGGQIGWSAPSQQVYNTGADTWEFAFSADRTYLASIRSRGDYTLEIWNIPQKSLITPSQNLQETLGSPLYGAALSWSPTSLSLAIYTNLGGG